MADGRTRVVTEGKARFNAFILPGGSGESPGAEPWESRGVPTKSMPVFYNPDMSKNRDLSVVAVHAWHEARGHPLRIADVMCGGGLHGIRYLVELPPGACAVDFVDMNPAAVRACQVNVALNGIDPASCSFHVQEANEFCFAEGKAEEHRFDVIDVDPFGNPVLYLQGALRALRKTGGLLQVNATDLAVLTGVHYMASRRKYQVMPLRNVSYHAEVSARVLLGSIFKEAMQQDFSIKPLLSVARRHFIKVVVEKVTGASRANKDFQHLGYVVACRDCFNHFTVHMDDVKGRVSCKHCQSTRIDAGGPLWTGPVHDATFCDGMLASLGGMDHVPSRKEAAKLLVLCRDGAGLPPGSHEVHKVAKAMGTVPYIPDFEAVVAELRARGFDAARDAFNPQAIKTTAPREEIERVLASARPGR